MLDFDLPALAAAVERLAPGQLDGLPFGAIRLGENGRVEFYSRTEARLSGFADRPVLGRDFFHEIAPCMDRPEFRGRIEAARAAGRIDIEFGWVGDFADRDRELRVRIQQGSAGSCWIFIKRMG